MTLTELKAGTYCAVRVLEPSNAMLGNFIQAHGLPTIKTSRENRRHVTLLYSRNHLPDFVPSPTLTHLARFMSYELFDTKPNSPDSKKCLVMQLSAPTLTARFAQLMSEHPATYDFPTYKPHITLTYEVPNDFDVGQLPPFAEDIMLGEEYSEDLIT